MKWTRKFDRCGDDLVQVMARIRNCIQDRWLHFFGLKTATPPGRYLVSVYLDIDASVHVYRECLLRARRRDVAALNRLREELSE